MRLLENMQRMRGRVYLEDGAIEPWQLTVDGRHRQVADSESWHALSVDSKDEVHGCARLRPFQFPVDYEALSARQSEIAHSDQWGVRLERAVRNEIARAKERGIGFVEVGGWALSSELRCSTEALKIVLAMYGLGEVLGGVIGITTATLRHCSSTILRRIGGDLLRDGDASIPRYYDSQYKCDMEILRFDSSAPNPRYQSWVDGLASDLRRTPVIAGGQNAAVVAAACSLEGETRGHLGFSPLLQSV